jgi:hypothetical protein
VRDILFPVESLGGGGGRKSSPSTGVANFNPLEGHTTRKDSPEGRMFVFMNRKGGGGAV